MPNRENTPARPAAKPPMRDCRAADACRSPPARRWGWLTALLLLPAAGGMWLAVRGCLEWDNFGVVEPGRIYRSGQLRPAQLEKLIKRHKIKTIIKTNIPELSIPDMAREREVCRRHDVRVAALIMPGDGRGEFDQYDRALAWLRDRRNLPALVTCARGTHRTGAIVAVYRVLEQDWPVDRALAEMKAYRFDPGGRRGRAEHPLSAHLRAYFKERLDHE